MYLNTNKKVNIKFILNFLFVFFYYYLIIHYNFKLFYYIL